MNARYLPSATLAALAVGACGRAPLPAESEWVVWRCRVVLDVPAPALPSIRVDKNPEHCGACLVDPVLLVDGDRGIANCVVSLTPVEWDVVTPPVSRQVDVGNRSCLMEPRVQSVGVGSELVLTNADGITHNPHVWRPDGRSVANVTLFNDQYRPRYPLDVAGAWRVDCDIHDWMHGYVFVFDHALHAVTDGAGAASFAARCPPGRYRLTVWHEVLGEHCQDVVVGADEVVVTLPLADCRPSVRIPHGMQAWLPR